MAVVRERTQRGAAAVEAAVMVGLVLFPLVMGVLHVGDLLFQRQHVDLTAQIPQADESGVKFWRQGDTCVSLANRIRDAFAASLMRSNHDLFDGESELSSLLVASVTSIPDTPAVYVEFGWDADLLRAWAERTDNEGLRISLTNSAGRIESAWYTNGTGECRSS